MTEISDDLVRLSEKYKYTVNVEIRPLYIPRKDKTPVSRNLPVYISYEALEQYFEYPVKVAAKKLNVAKTTLIK